MDIQHAISDVIAGRDLDGQAMTDVMRQIMTGAASDAQIGGFLVGLRMKGETIAEIAGAAEVMRSLATRVPVSGDHLVDTCGTGGDQSGTFNISTAAAFVVAAAGGAVAKHGNRSVSSKSGSADVLEKAGVNLALTPDQVAECINKVGVGLMFAPKHHGAMKYAIGPRKELATRTIFNILGPLTNPAGAPNQVLGVYDAALTEPLAKVLQRLGSRHVMVVHAEEGLDEIGLSSTSQISELKDDKVTTYTVTPEQFGFAKADPATIAVSSVDESLAMVLSVLKGESSPAADIVALNAGAAIYVAGLQPSLAEGIARAQTVVQSGEAFHRLEQLVALSQSMGAV